MGYQPPKSESKTTCRHCGRLPGGVHKKDCKRGKRYARPWAFKPPPKLSYGYPIANIFDCVGGKINVVPIPRGTRMRVQL